MKVGELKNKLEDANQEVELLRSEKEKEVAHAKMLYETERLNLKCELEVKSKVLQQEIVLLKDDQRKLRKAH
jgi:hypothetical protein